MKINIGDVITQGRSRTRYIVMGFRPNGKIVARNPNFGHFGRPNNMDYGFEVMPEHLAEYVAVGLCRVIKKDAVLV